MGISVVANIINKGKATGSLLDLANSLEAGTSGQEIHSLPGFRGLSLALAESTSYGVVVFATRAQANTAMAIVENFWRTRLPALTSDIMPGKVLEAGAVTPDARMVWVAPVTGPAANGTPTNDALDAASTPV